MPVDDRTLALQSARAQERRGDLKGAADTYYSVGAFDDAIRVMASAGRLEEAANYAIAASSISVLGSSRIDPQGRKLALKGAILLGQAGQFDRAIELFVTLGEHQRAADLREASGGARAPVPSHRQGSQPQQPRPPSAPAQAPPQQAGGAHGRTLEASGDIDGAIAAYLASGQPGEAARLVRKQGRPAEAAELFAKAGMPYEAGVCFHEARDPARCLDQLLSVPREHPKYRHACVQAIRLANELNSFDFRLDQQLAPFVQSPPQNEREADALYKAALYYEAQGVAEVARKALDSLLAVVPNHPAARNLRARLGNDRAPADLPDLPNAPNLPGWNDVSNTFEPTAPPHIANQTAHLAHARTHHASPPQPAPAPPPAVAPTQPPPQAPEPAPQIVGELQPGQVVAGRYNIEKKVGQGGMAAVYRAHDTELDETIAIKIFLPGQETAEMLSRFKQELLLSRQLAHPNIVRLHDMGVHQGCRFITMELLRGRDLEALLQARGKPFDLDEGLRYLIQACAGLFVAHEQGIIHRDVKLDNFFVTDEGQLKIMDFGIAKKKSAMGVTVAGFIAGTPAYIAPEQISNFSNVTPSADLYALGVAAYRMFTGGYPFEHDEMMPLLIMHLTDPPPPPSQRNPRISRDLEQVILRLLAKEPGQRYANARELAKALQEVLVKAGLKGR